MKLNYFTKHETYLPKQLLFLQAVLGIKSCQTQGGVCKILDDIWKIAQRNQRWRK